MTRATVLFGIVLLLSAARATAQTTLTPVSALHQAYTQRASISTNRQRLEEARRNAAAAGAYPATRLDLGHNLFNQVDIGGSPDLVLYQPIDAFGKTRALRRQGEAAVVTAQAALRQGALDVQQEVLTAYANLLSAQRLLALARTQRDIAEAVRVSTSKRVAARDLPAIQADRASLEVQRADQLVTDRLSAVEAARLRLAAALGIDKLSAEDLAPLDRPSDPTADPAAARPELLTLRSEAAQAVADERVARQGLVPDLEIQAGRSPFDQTPSQYNARLQLAVTLWDNGATKNKIRAAEAHRKAAESDLQDRLKSAQKDIEASKVELDAAEASVAGYAKLAEGARSLLDRTQRGFELGANTLIDVLDARRALADAQELTVNANLRRDLAIEGYLRSQGRLLEEPK